MRLVLLHRTGRVEIAQPSVLIAVATPHRADAFDEVGELLARDRPLPRGVDRIVEVVKHDTVREHGGYYRSLRVRDCSRADAGV